MHTQVICNLGTAKAVELACSSWRRSSRDSFSLALDPSDLLTLLCLSGLMSRL